MLNQSYKTKTLFWHGFTATIVILSLVWIFTGFGRWFPNLMLGISGVGVLIIWYVTLKTDLELEN